MRIHHVTVPAHAPERVARVLAEIFGAKVMPLPRPEGARIVFAGDPDGSAIEVWPAGTRGAVAASALTITDRPLPEEWPHHAYVTTDASDADRILAIFAREGWRAERVQNGPPHVGFSLVRGWIENHACMEIGGSEMRAEYERFFQKAAAR